MKLEAKLFCLTLPLALAGGVAKARPALPAPPLAQVFAAAPLGNGPDASSGATENVPEEGFGLTLVRMLVVLGLVLGLVYLTLNFGLRRLLGVQATNSGLGGWVKVLQRIPLDAKKSLYVVKAGQEYLLLGGGDQNVNLLAKLDAEEAQRLERERPSKANASPFLTKLLSRRGGSPPPAE